MVRLLRHLRLFVLGALLASCGLGRLPSNFTGGAGTCDGQVLGLFQIDALQSYTNPGYVDLKITVLQVLQPNTLVRVLLASNGLNSTELVTAKAMQAGTVLYENLVTPQALAAFQAVVIMPYRAGTGSPLGDTALGNEVYCQIPAY